MPQFCKRAWAEISLDNLTYNYNKIKNRLGNTGIVATVKADAYGHCEKYVSQKLEQLGTPYFSVSNIDEAKILRSRGVKKPIIILGYTPCECAECLIKYDIIQTVFSPEYADALNKEAERIGAKSSVHIKLDTGMSRIGFCCNDAAKVLEQIKHVCSMSNLEVSGIYTHLSHADSFSDDAINFTEKQKCQFDDIVNMLYDMNYNIENRHIQNSIAIQTYGGCGYELARPGISLYGIQPSDEIKMDLKAVMSLKSVISMVKEVPEGTPIGYGRTFCTDRPTVVATVSIGYGDGYSRLLSNKGQVLINGKRANIIGNVCMDQLMVDVTGIPAKQDDVVTLIGSDGGQSITANDLADSIGTIGYEISCMINKRVPRVIIENEKIIDVVTMTN